MTEKLQNVFLETLHDLSLSIAYLRNSTLLPYLHYWWCGYVKLNPGSRFINSDYNDIPVECHGNLTFKGYLQGMPEGMWIGFDTNHYMDNMNVKNQEFVETECKKIIEQLIGLESE